MLIEAKKARKRLTFLWFSGFGILLMIFVIQHLNGKFEDRSSEAWKWFFSYTLTFISLVSGTFFMDMRKSKSEKVDKTYFNLSFFASFFYLIILFLIFLMYPFSGTSILDFYANCDIFLLPLQGIVSGIIGIFFIKGYGN
jgi:cytochrome bd-type quinol oxidase subunit 2